VLEDYPVPTHLSSFGLVTTLLLFSLTSPLLPLSSQLSLTAQAQTIQNRKDEAEQLILRGDQQVEKGQLPAALANYQQALAIFREVEAKYDAALTLSKLGIIYWKSYQFTVALENYQQALVIFREVDAQSSVAITLNNIGTVYWNLGQYSQALKYYQQASKLPTNIQEVVFNNIGVVYKSQGQYHQALEFYQKALKIGASVNQGNTLNNIGEVYRNLGQYARSIEYYQQALKKFKTQDSFIVTGSGGLPPDPTAALIVPPPIIRNHFDAVSNSSGQAATLHNLGVVYTELGQYFQALEFYQKALAIQREIGDKLGEGTTLNSIGSVYYEQGKTSQALEFYQQALTVHRVAQDRSREGTTLNNIGLIYDQLGQPYRGLKPLLQALAIFRDLGDRAGEGNTLDSLGTVYASLGQYAQALDFYQQALAISREVGNRAIEQFTLSHIGSLFEKQNQPELAIVFFKQFVNVTQAIRQDLRVLPLEQQQSFTETIASTYRRLADLLLQQDRVLEAQRVLDLLKVQELEDYLSNVRGSDNTARGVAERSPEQQIKEGYEAILNRAIEQGKEIAQLEGIPVSNRTSAQRQRVIELRKNQQFLTQQFQEFLNSPEVKALIAQLRQTTRGENFDLERYATALQDNLKRLQQDAVILYPFVLDDRLELVLVTPYAPPIRRTVAVKREDLNRVIAEFRSTLEKPTTDATVPARQLYDWLIKPIENDLAQAQAKTIIYAPDGQLRYIPLAALYDGNQWLVQRFRINNITAISLTEFNTKPQGKLQVLAGAFTSGSYSVQVGSRQFSLQGLKYASVEVENLAKIVPNTTKVLDKQFNRDTVLQMNDYSVVHLATHAAFVTGQPEESFILFGDGSRATLRDIEGWRLPNVDLMVLSACETFIVITGISS
jgi:CHAT domain-containing protein/Tfp pilus assembly protein PilF